MRLALGLFLGLLAGACVDEYGGSSTSGGGGGCCVRCTSSKPCGNSCIAFDKTCNVGAGCACAQLDENEHDLELVEEDSTT